MSILPSWLSLVLTSLPIWLVWLAGMLFALVTWRKHPPVSLTAFLGCALLLTTSVAGTAATVWLIEQHAQSSTVWAAVSLARAVFSTVGYVLLLVALFGWRSQRSAARIHTIREDDLDLPLHQPGHTGFQPPDALP